MAIVPESLRQMTDLAKVRALYARLERPYWMADPLAWVWVRPDGRPQGFGPLAQANPGLCNLLWLAMDMGRPPRQYDAAANGLYSILMLHAGAARLDGEPLLDVAGLLPLREFAARLPGAGDSGQPAQRTYPLLSLLAERRLDHADT